MASSERGGPELSRVKSSVIWAIHTTLKPLKPLADIARMAPDPKQTPSAKLTPQDLWKDISLTRSGIDPLLKQGEETGDLKPVRAALDELQLKTSNYEKLVEEMQAPLKAVLGKNFLGTAEWLKGFGVNVGAPPPIPESITPELLNSKCPLHPGQLIKDTHILLLIPKTVDGQPYSALRLDELCATRKGSGERLIFDQADWANEWKTEPWANALPAESAWTLIPKSDPDPYKVPEGQHFRNKFDCEQERVHNTYYAEQYRQANTIEVMTAALLHDVVHGEPRMLTDHLLLRCAEPTMRKQIRIRGIFHKWAPPEGWVQVGEFDGDGLRIRAHFDSSNDFFTGRALVRKA
jgi:hypothetical protein